MKKISEKISYKSENSTPLSKKVYLIGLLTFFSIIATAVLHSNDSEFFNSLFAISVTPLSEEIIIQYSSLYDSIYYFAYIVGLLIGPISDKLGKRKIFISTGSIFFIFASVLLLKSPNFNFLLIMRLIQGISHIMVWQSLMVMVYDYSDKTNRAKSYAIYSIFIGLAMGVGTMLGGILADIGAFVPMFFSIISYFIVLSVSSLFLKESDKNYIRPHFQDGLFLIRNNPKVIVPSLFNFIDRFHMGFLISIVPLYLTYVIPCKPSIRGMIFGMSAIPPLFISYPVGKRSDQKWGRFKPLIFGSSIYGILMVFIGYLSRDSLIIFTILLLLQGCAQGFSTAPTNSLLGDIIAPKNNAAAISIFNFFGNIGLILGPVFCILFSNNYNLAFMVAGLIELISLGLNLFLAKKMSFPQLKKLR